MIFRLKKEKKKIPPCQECGEGGLLLFFLREQCVLLYYCGYLYIMLYMLLSCDLDPVGTSLHNKGEIEKKIPIKTNKYK